MPVFFSKSLKTWSYQPSPFSPLRPSALYTVTTLASAAAESPPHAVSEPARTRLPVTAAIGTRRSERLFLGMAR